MSAMTEALSNFMWRRTAERVETEETDDHPLSDIDRDSNSIADEEEGEFVGSSNATTPGTGIAPEALPNDEEDEDGREGETPRLVSTAVSAPPSASGGAVRSSTGRVSESSPAVVVLRDRSSTRPARISLRDLEEERDIVRRRTSACVLLSSFILLRLWIQAVVSGDFGLLLLCLVFTSWTARFIRHTREREEELDRMISDFDENNNGDDAANDARIRRLSFQSQLALAIVQSQMQMMQGGYGHPDGLDNRPGVSEDAKRNWDRFEYKSAGILKNKGSYGSVGQTEELGKGDDTEGSDEEPHCSICLCEYENSNKLVCLPCKHIFHDDCISSWTDHNTRCPLCNFDLESAIGDNAV